MRSKPEQAVTGGPPAPDDETFALIRLTLTPGLGPVLARRAIEQFGSARHVLDASPAQLERIERIGRTSARRIRNGINRSEDLAHEEVALVHEHGVRLVARHDPTYPPLLRDIPDPPALLYVLGSLDAGGADRFGVGVVGSRSCSGYAVEQSERYAGSFASAGLCVLSGGARGVDTAAHRAALRARGRTVAVLGCGLARRYPPENAELFDAIVSRGGALVSELPMRTNPSAENFPARNRLISGMSLGVVVIEAGRRSGALITARVAVEEHGRDAFCLPSRADSRSAEGSLRLLRDGGAAMTLEPADVIQALEAPARHLHQGSHRDRYADPARALPTPSAGEPKPERNAVPKARRRAERPMPVDGPPERVAILRALSEELTLDELIEKTGLDAASVRVQLTGLELERRVVRRGTRLARA